MAEVVWRRAEEIAEVDSGDRVVLVNLSSGASRPEVVTGTGAQVWRLLAGPITVHELACHLADDHGIDLAVALTATEVFLRQLQESGLAGPG